MGNPGQSFAVMSMCVISLTLTLGGAKPHQDGLPYSDANRWPNGDRPQAHLQGSSQPLKCDCYVRLDADKVKAEWYCSSSSDYECQYVSLEELDMLVQTEAEVEEGKKNHMEDMLAQDVSKSKSCICSVGINQDNGPMEYYCNGLSCYLLGNEVSKSDKRAGSQEIVFSRNHCPRPRDPTHPCCRCVRGKWICSDRHCPVLPCANTKHEPGQCCPKCEKYPVRTQSIAVEEKQPTECVEDLVNKPCCRCYHGQLNCVDRATFCHPPPCSNPVQLSGICCPTCQVRSQLSSCNNHCPYYREHPAFTNTMSYCGCNINCLKKEQENCMSYM